MRFADISYINGFWVILGLLGFFLWARKSRELKMRTFADRESLQLLTRSVSYKKKALKEILIISVFVFAYFSLMRPQWGFQWQEVRRKGLDVIIAIDTSKSMLATDIKPNRLERSKLALKDLVGRLKGDRIGLVAFSGTAFLQCPLTVDYGGFLLALSDLSVSTIPRGGTSISSAIKTAIDSFEEGGENQFKALIIITDGEDHEGDPLAAAELAKKHRIKIFCVGIGTRDGELIRVRDKDGNRVFLKDREGNVVKSKLNEGILKRIALITGGIYVRSSGAEFGLDLIYDERLSKMEKRDIKAQMKKQFYERFQLPLLFALFLLLIEPVITDRKRS